MREPEDRRKRWLGRGVLAICRDRRGESLNVNESSTIMQVRKYPSPPMDVIFLLFRSKWKDVIGCGTNDVLV